MAYRYPECEFCVNHRVNDDACEQCDDGDCYEDIEDRQARKHKQPKQKVIEVVSLHQDSTFSQGVYPLNFQPKDQQ